MPVMIAEPLAMSVEQRAALETMARSSSLPHRKVVQARALLLAGEGVPPTRWPAAAIRQRRRCGRGGAGSRPRGSTGWAGSPRAGAGGRGCRRDGGGGGEDHFDRVA